MLPSILHEEVDRATDTKHAISYQNDSTDNCCDRTYQEGDTEQHTSNSVELSLT